MLDENYKNSEIWESNRKKDPKRFKKNSILCASSGWSDLYLYKTYGNTYYLEQSAKNFNDCWKYDPENYNSYWGWGIVIAEARACGRTSERLLTALKLFKMAKAKGIPAEEQANFDLDLANLYNGLGAYSILSGKSSAAAEYLKLSRDLLLPLLKENTSLGRASFLMSVNYFFRNDFRQAEKFIQKAAEAKFPIPESYQKDLNAKLKKCF